MTDWGNSFWSQMYNDFDQVQMPDNAELVADPNPHAMLDLHRWFAPKPPITSDFRRRRHAPHVKNQWITTNFMMNYDLVNPALSEHDLDILTFTMYPVSGGLFQGQLGFRMGDPALVSFHSRFPAESRQRRRRPDGIAARAGQLGAGESVAAAWRHSLPGLCGLSRWEDDWSALIGTASRSSGDELYHKTMVEPDGVTLAPGGREFVESIKDVRRLRTLYRPATPRPRRYTRPGARPFSIALKTAGTSTTTNKRCDGTPLITG